MQVDDLAPTCNCSSGRAGSLSAGVQVTSIDEGGRSVVKTRQTCRKNDFFSHIFYLSGHGHNLT
jgi:hypothetical protein